MVYNCSVKDYQKNQKWEWNHIPSAQTKETDYYQNSKIWKKWQFIYNLFCIRSYSQQEQFVSGGSKENLLVLVLKYVFLHKKNAVRCYQVLSVVSCWKTACPINELFFLGGFIEQVIASFPELLLKVSLPALKTDMQVKWQSSLSKESDIQHTHHMDLEISVYLYVILSQVYFSVVFS